MTLVKSKIFIVIPAYNEAANIAMVLETLTQFPYAIIVVNDGSKDKTADIVSKFDRVYLFNHIINRGMGAALQTGTTAALSLGADFIIHFDADGQMQAKDIPNMIEPLAKGEVEITLGSRFLATKNSLPWLKKIFIHPISRVINYFFIRIMLTDVHNGFRAMTAQAAKQITISQDGMAHNTEITQQIRKLNLRFKEVPVDILYHEFGQGIGGGFKILWDLLIK